MNHFMMIAMVMKIPALWQIEQYKKFAIMQGYQEWYVYFLTNHHKNTVAYIQIPKSSLSHPLFY